LPWLLSFTIGLVGAALIGVLVEFLVIRRFFDSSRLVLTVATIGLSQLFLVLALLVPQIWGDLTLDTTKVDFPWHVSFAIGTQLFTGDTIAAVGVAVVALAALAVFLG